MLSFRDTFFFVKFSVLFFILVIFGYWGIDLNSEELYIAFSFFLLVIYAVALFRTAILLFFVNTLNRKYQRILVDLLTMTGVVGLQLDNLVFLRKIVSTFKMTVNYFLNRIVSSLKLDHNYVISHIIARTNFLKIAVILAVNSVSTTLFNTRKFVAFSARFSKFFTITIN